MEKFEITIVHDDRCIEPGFRGGFGFAALIANKNTGHYLLFDTGGDGRVLLHNLQQVNVKPEQIDKVIISHNHHDHTGGLKAVYSQNNNLKIYVPQANSRRFERTFSEAKVTGITDLKKIEEKVLSSGQFGSFIKEEALYLETEEQEIVIIVGCTHPGLENFIVKARELGNIKAVIGGFHGFNKFSYLEDIEIIGACHCTRHLKEIKQQFPDHYQRTCVGTTFTF